MRKHKIYWHFWSWCAECGSCGQYLHSTRWSGALELLRYHVEEHQTLTEEPVLVDA